MDMKKSNRSQNRNILSQLSAGKFVVGSKQLKKAVRAGNVRFVVLAENADPAVTEPLAQLCRQHSIQITWVRTMAELGRACGIEVGAAAAAAVN